MPSLQWNRVGMGKYVCIMRILRCFDFLSAAKHEMQPWRDRTFKEIRYLANKGKGATDSHLIMRIISFLVILISRIRRRVKMVFLRSVFRKAGRGFVFDPDGHYSFSTIEVGDDVYIGAGAILQAPMSSITIGNKVMLGPNVTILGGDHSFSEIGRFMFDVHDKKPGDDLPVVIEDDVWIGANAVLLKGVRIGRGSIVAAGALVRNEIPPYCICAGIPAKIVGIRWSIDELRKHEEALYPPERRLNDATLSILANIKENFSKK
jgi:acetyltransferase-like isoleucine patch superfamily enzyme